MLIEHIMELGYWPIRGRAEALRLLLAYLHIEYKEHNPVSPQEILENAKHGFEFPNVPYLVDGDVKLTESSAIPRYIAWKAGKKDLYGKEGLEAARHQMILGVLEDIGTGFKDILFKDDVEGAYKAASEKSGRKIQELSKFLGDKNFFFGEVTYSDIIFFVLFRAIRSILKAVQKPDIFAAFPNLEKHHQNVANLPGIKEYIQTDARHKLPFLPPYMLKIQLQD